MKYKLVILAVMCMISVNAFSESSSKYNKFEWGQLYIAASKLNKKYNVENDALCAMKVLYNDVYKKYKNDEFEFDDQLKNIANKLRKTVQEHELNKLYKLNVVTTFDEYDFKKEEFPINGFTKNSYFSEHYNSLKFKCGYDNKISIRDTYYMFYSNPHIVTGIKMPKAEAKAFLKKRKRYGEVNRHLYLDVFVKINRKRKTDFKKLGVGNQLMGEIQKINIYDDDKRTKLLAAIKK